MSRAPSRNVSSSTVRSRVQSPNQTENASSNIAYPPYHPNSLGVSSNEWQAWNTRPTSSMGNMQNVYAAGAVTSDARRSLPDTVIQMADDGWRTTSHRPINMPLDTGQHMDALNTSMTAMGIGLGKPSVAQATQWFSQPVSSESSAGLLDVRFSQTPSPSAALTAYPSLASNPYGQAHISPIDDFHNGSFRGMPAPADEEFQAIHQMPGTQFGLQQPPMFPQMPGPCNPNLSREYGTYHLMSPTEPFTDFTFGFDNNHNPLGPPQFSGPGNQLFPNPLQLQLQNPPEARPMHLMPFDYPPPQLPFFFPPSPHLMNMMPPMPPPQGLVGLQGPVNLANNFPRQRRDPPFPMGPSTLNSLTLPPRQNRYQRSPQMRGQYQHLGPQFPLSSGPQQGRAMRRPQVMASPVSARSVLMESFRNGNRDKQWTLQDIIGHIVEFSGDQNGSRLIQQQLEVANDEGRQRVFDEIVPEKTDQLVQDVFGNYVIQKFFELGSSSQKDALSQAVETNVVKYSLQIYACRVVQKAFEYMPEVQQDRLISTIENNFLLCVKDEHGNHVIQKLVETMPPERLTFLQFISQNVCEVATNSNGCRVLQKCLMKLSNQHTRPLLDAIHRQANTLMRDQYGNYVIQFILQHGQEQDRALAIGRVRGSLVRLSKNQYASHVCEKAIVYSAPEVRHILLEELTNPRPGENPILVMIKDDYANYVLQKALTESEGEQKEVLYQRVKTVLIPLRRMTTSYNKQLVKIERLIDRHFARQEKAAEAHMAVLTVPGM